MTVETVDPATLKKWLDSGEAVLVDVREPGEFEAEHVEGAALVPLGAVCRAALPEREGRKLVIMCKLGGRGNSACRKLSEEVSAPETVYNLQGGIEAWKRAGLPVARPARSASPRKGGFFARLFGAGAR
ncbi:MAG: rhodanese-like domain-containing protein [Rhodomicrobium sp.]